MGRSLRSALPRSLLTTTLLSALVLGEWLRRAGGRHCCAAVCRFLIRALRNTFVLDKLLLPSKVDGDRRWGNHRRIGGFPGNELPEVRNLRWLSYAKPLAIASLNLCLSWEFRLQMWSFSVTTCMTLTSASLSSALRRSLLLSRGKALTSLLQVLQ